MIVLQVPIKILAAPRDPCRGATGSCLADAHGLGRDPMHLDLEHFLWDVFLSSTPTSIGCHTAKNYTPVCKEPLNLDQVAVVAVHSSVPKWLAASAGMSGSRSVSSLRIAQRD